MKPIVVLIAVLGLSLQAASQTCPAGQELVANPSDPRGYCVEACPPGYSRIQTGYGSYCSKGENNPTSPGGQQVAQTPQQQARMEEPRKDEAQLSPLPKVAELKLAAKFVHVTLAKCEADAGAYSDSPTPELISSISDSRLHELNTEAFACMKLGGTGAGYGWQLKTVVDAAYTGHFVMTALRKERSDFANQVKDKVVGPLVDQHNDLVKKYNELVLKYNALLSYAQAEESYANQLRQADNQLRNAVATLVVGAALLSRYSQPAEVNVTVPSTIYVRQSPVHCSTVTQPTITGQVFTYTNCY